MIGSNSDLTKRYWLFSFDNYYPSGGMNDFNDSFETMEEAMALAVKNRRDCDELWDNVDKKYYYLEWGNSPTLWCRWTLRNT